MPLVDKLRAAKVKLGKLVKRPSVWQGPCGAGPQGGVTQGLLGRWLACKERFRLLAMEGWKPADRLESRMEWGSLWHCAEEALAGLSLTVGTSRNAWENALTTYAKHLCQRYPMEQQQVEAMYGVIKTMFPVYVAHWAKNDQVKERTPLLQEYSFDVPFKLPSGRIVRLRGKWDAVDLVGKGKAAGVWLFETKTKSDPDEQQIIRQLSFDLQTLLYLVALQEYRNDLSQSGSTIKGDWPLRGVRYNVVRRPRQYQGKKETRQEFLERLGAIIAASPGEFFMRWNAVITPTDLARFKREFLVPALENLADDYEWWHYCSIHADLSKTIGLPTDCQYDDAIRSKYYSNHRARHFRTPYGLYSPLAEGGSTDLDELVANGSVVGLRQVDDLFPELAQGD